MNDPSPKSNGYRVLTLIWAAVALVLGGVVAWAAMQTDDPLSNYIHTDKARHILAFGAIGVCAAFMPSARLRIVALAGTLTFAMMVEIIQIPIPDRTASMSDLFASVVGCFGGFGLGAAATTVFDLARGVSRPARVRERPPTP
jgi:VanZ family protein